MSSVTGPSADGRRLEYLERELQQLRRVARRDLGPLRLGGGVLASAALATAGRGTPEIAVRWAGKALDGCRNQWLTVRCERLLIPLQRAVLQFPDVFPSGLQLRLRAVAVTGAPPPGEDDVRAPWSFQETENQRIVKIAYSLIAQVVAGTPESPAAEAWSRYAAAFLQAHEQDGWYEADSPGYLGISIPALVHLADFAPTAEVRELAARQLDRLFGAWAGNQVGGFPAGPQSRAYAHWALDPSLTPWQAWGWLLGGIGDPEQISFLDWPDLAVSRYRVPEEVQKRVAGRSREEPYEIRSRRRLLATRRQPVDAALYGYATPDYILSAVQSVAGLRLVVSGGQEILGALWPERCGFAPLYLWSRTDDPAAGDRWKSWSRQDFTIGHRNVVLARLGVGGGTGYAYLAPGWSRPEPVGEALVSRCGATWIALFSPGGWEVAPAARRFPGYFEGRNLQGAWAAVPRRQPAAVALEVGRESEEESFERWKSRAEGRQLRVQEGEAGELRFRTLDGAELSFVPGESAAVEGAPIEAWKY